jgi:hypothetical protein
MANFFLLFFFAWEASRLQAFQVSTSAPSHGMSVRQSQTWTLLAGIMVRILRLSSSDTITFASLFPPPSLSVSTTSLPWVDVHHVHSTHTFGDLSRVFPYSLSQVHRLTRMYNI